MVQEQRKDAQLSDGSGPCFVKVDENVLLRSSAPSTAEAAPTRQHCSEGSEDEGQVGRDSTHPGRFWQICSRQK